jgi:hypothetical protein
LTATAITLACPFTAQGQPVYDCMLADLIHQRGMSIALKNNLIKWLTCSAQLKLAVKSNAWSTATVKDCTVHPCRHGHLPRRVSPANDDFYPQAKANHFSLMNKIKSRRQAADPANNAFPVEAVPRDEQTAASGSPLHHGDGVDRATGKGDTLICVGL